MQIDLEVDGAGCGSLAVEAGGHRIQRVPPTEKRGRVHTSTVTVAVMDVSEAAATKLLDRDLQITWFSGTGKGGQHRNKHQNSCRVLHLPSGITETRQSREKEANLREAKEAIERRLSTHAADQIAAVNAGWRRKQVGSGMRGDKTVTIRFQDDTVTHHGTGKTSSARRYMRGEMEAVW